MTAPKVRRMDKIEARLTPKEWAIRYADELRAAPNLRAYVHRTPYRDMGAVFLALAKDQHPGAGHAADAARLKLAYKFQADFKPGST